jgi:hypothetical protein
MYRKLVGQSAADLVTKTVLPYQNQQMGASPGGPIGQGAVRLSW